MSCGGGAADTCLDKCCSDVYDSGMSVTRRPRSARRFDSLPQQVFLNLWRTYDRLRALEEDFFGGYDLTAQQYNVLRILAAEFGGAVRTLDLAARLVSRAPDITRMLDKLAARGLVARDRPVDNRRVVEGRIRAVGRALLAAMREPLRKCHQRQLGHLDRDTLARLSDLLHQARLPHEPATSDWR